MQGYSEGFQAAAAATFDTACMPDKYTDKSCTDFISQKNMEFLNEQINRKDNTAINAFNTFQRVTDADRNSAIGMIRTQDLVALKSGAVATNEKLKNIYDFDSDVSRRQFEINEYHYYNKLDTLFFLQLFFIAVLVMAILVYFNRRGTLTTQMTGLLTAILAVLLLVVGISRYFYTIRTRDRRLWHRRYFQSEKEPGPALLSTCPGPSTTATINLNAIFDKSQVDCAVDTSDKFNAWKKAANEEVANQIAKGNMAGSIFAPSGFSISDKCRKR